MDDFPDKDWLDWCNQLSEQLPIAPGQLPPHPLRDELAQQRAVREEISAQLSMPEAASRCQRGLLYLLTQLAQRSPSERAAVDELLQELAALWSSRTEVCQLAAAAGQVIDWEEALQLNPNTLLVVEQTAIEALGSGDVAAAAGLFQLLTQIKPRLSRFWVELALCHYLLQSYDEALFLCEEALRVFPGQVELQVIKAACQRASGDGAAGETLAAAQHSLSAAAGPWQEWLSDLAKNNIR